jgi:hypothetical protein
MKQIPTKIRVRFGKETVLLKDANDVQTTKSGVSIRVKIKAGREVQPIVSIPDGTLGIYMHTRPVITAVDWVTK